MREELEEILRLMKKVNDLELALQIDRAEIVRLRRWIEKLEEGNTDD